MSQFACGTCHKSFANGSAFDNHRVGKWHNSIAPRRCRTDEEMLAAGVQNDNGVWRVDQDSTTRPDDEHMPVMAIAFLGAGKHL